ncbi:TIGR01244 family sulfur transferase [Octadecabacter sp. 1_MG-2023]|uniref:TIGR01244 family sulfur transferase n=1 Tax=unclassified Octadecabacter TaxID=196158 RepID=UPI001C0A088A|nr:MULTISPECIES: TIGR01244 family sulfur transferase [unclassified Octadecabacter]MBU2993007.1 TIGR01244 family phosphatase [Octadecabacter sp. B2R22]MDO6733541.1 TIGR01244 family sulfur transferase [Octadecabacter sp. 1_MG-2023]
MDIRPLTPAYAVSPQINPEDLPAIAAAGYKTVINNRPDEENPPSHQNDAMKNAAEAAGITLVTLPVSHATLTLETVAAQKEAIAASAGPVLAYCASGNRSTIVWALGQAGQIETDEIVQIAANNGYNLSQMRGQLDMLAQQG